MATLLRSTFHNYQHLVAGVSHRSLPPSLKDAMNLIRKNRKDDIRSCDLASAAGISPRAIQTLFKMYLRMSPMHYVRAMRLAEVRRELLDSRGSDTHSLTELSQKWGLKHFGCQRRSKILPQGGAKPGHFGFGHDARHEAAASQPRSPDIWRLTGRLGPLGPRQRGSAQAVSVDLRARLCARR